ncbi:MAG: FAD-dependent oxidoreductase, partial [Planctomycetota bacterium]|nr:FAD-dependent oxidoreductase [Planctomycetota bacterium]
YSKSKEIHGPQKTKTIWELTRQNQALLEEVIRSENLSCDYQKTGSYRAASSEAEAKVLQESAEQLERDRVAVERRSLPGFPEAFFSPEDALFHPVKFVRELARVAEKNGARIFEKSKVESVHDALVKTKEGSLQGEMVLFATGGFSPLLHPFLGEMIAPVRGQCLSTAPMDHRLFSAPVVTNWGLDSFAQLPGGEFLFTGGRHVAMQKEYTWSEKTSKEIQDYLDQSLQKVVPFDSLPEVRHRWAGVMDFSCDELPNVGPLPGTICSYSVAGFHGSGLSLGLISAKMVSEMMLEGKTDYECDLFSPRRHL